MNRRTWICAAAVVLLGAAWAVGGEIWAIGGFDAVAVSDHGAILGPSSIWSNAGGLQFFPGRFQARNFTSDGQFLVGRVDLQGGLPAKMRLGQSPEVLPKVGERVFQGWANAVSEDGQTIIGEVSDQAVRWSKSGNTVFERIVTGPNPWDPVISPFRLVDVSADGSTVVGDAGVSWTDANGDVQSRFVPFYWTEARGLRLVESPWPNETHELRAEAVSGDGKAILCEHSDPANNSNLTYLWSGARVFNLGKYSPVGMSDDGKTVLLGGMSGSYVWREGLGTVPVEDFLDVDLAGWSQPLYAERISPNGNYLVGHSVFNGQNTTWLAAVVVPEPSTFVLGLLGAIGIAVVVCRRRSATPP